MKKNNLTNKILGVSAGLIVLSILITMLIFRFTIL